MGGVPFSLLNTNLIDPTALQHDEAAPCILIQPARACYFEAESHLGAHLQNAQCHGGGHTSRHDQTVVAAAQWQLPSTPDEREFQHYMAGRLTLFTC